MQALPTALRVLSPAPFPLRSLASLGTAQRVVSVTASGGIGAAAGPIGKSGAIAGDRTLTVFVKREGDPDWAEVVLTSDATVSQLKKAIVAELPSLQGKDLSTLTLHVARDEAGKDLCDALDSRLTLAAANLQAGASIVVKVAGAGKKSASLRHAPVHLHKAYPAATVRFPPYHSRIFSLVCSGGGDRSLCSSVAGGPALCQVGAH
jgi:hypothetical protein